MNWLLVVLLKISYPHSYLKYDSRLVFSAPGVKGCVFYLQLTII